MPWPPLPQDYIASAKDNINEVMAQIAGRFPWAKKHMRIGFVGYRDFMRGPNKVWRWMGVIESG